jgi:hypothetical protein
MRKPLIVVAMTLLAAAMTALVPVTASAKSYSGDGAKLKNRSMTSRKVASSGGGGTGCLTGQTRALLGRIQAKFGKVQIVSTCRKGARIATTGKISKHATGQAVDFRVPGKKAAVIKWLIANHHSGGIMTYRDMDHIHVDVGYRFVSLGAYSGKS